MVIGTKVDLLPRGTVLDDVVQWLGDLLTPRLNVIDAFLVKVILTKKASPFLSTAHHIHDAHGTHCMIGVVFRARRLSTSMTPTAPVA